MRFYINNQSFKPSDVFIRNNRIIIRIVINNAIFETERIVVQYLIVFSKETFEFRMSQSGVIEVFILIKIFDRAVDMQSLLIVVNHFDPIICVIAMFEYLVLELLLNLYLI